MPISAEKEKCLRKIQNLIVLAIIGGSLIFLFPFLLVLLVFVFLKIDIDIKRVLKKYGVYDCIKLFLYKKDKYGNLINVRKELYDKMMNSKKGPSKIIRKKKDYKVDDISILETIENRYTPKESSDKSKRYESKFKHKSIWDDYESVLDKFKK